jgi:hypothetical protein
MSQIITKQFEKAGIIAQHPQKYVKSHFSLYCKYQIIYGTYALCICLTIKMVVIEAK